MAWHELSINGHKDEVAQLTELLEQQGAVAVTYRDGQDDPILEPGPQEITLWQDVVITGLFPLESHIEQITFAIQQQKPQARVTYHPLQEQNWVDAWLEHFKPQTFGRNLIIHPSSLPPDKATTQQTTVWLEPGMAFGTGQHPTTRLCLHWLAHASLANKTILDFGCGTSILAISALKLGCKQAYGIDYDEQALISSRHNAEKNKICAHELILSLTANDTIPPCDVVVANILMNPLLALSGTLANLCAPQGTLLLSGILTNQVNTIMAAYQTWFDFKPYCIDEDWILLVGHKTRGDHD